MLTIGIKIKAIKSPYYSDLVNSIYEGANGIITSISFPFGLHTVYDVEFDNCKKKHYYDYELNKSFILL